MPRRTPTRRVRREAVKLLLGYAATRETTLLASVRDPDERVAYCGILAAAHGCSAEVAAVIRQRIDEGELADGTVRAAGIRAAATQPDEETLAWILRRTLRRRARSCVALVSPRIARAARVAHRARGALVRRSPRGRRDRAGARRARARRSAPRCTRDERAGPLPHVVRAVGRDDGALRAVAPGAHARRGHIVPLLRDLQAHDAQPEFSFLGDEVVYGQHPLREMRDWEWAARLAARGRAATRVRRRRLARRVRGVPRGDRLAAGAPDARRRSTAAARPEQRARSASARSASAARAG